MADYSDYDAARAKQNRVHKDDLYATLTRHPAVARVVVTYDGVGDSGSIEQITYRDAADDDLVTVGGVTVARLHELDQFVEDYVYAALPRGWEDGSGSYGVCTIDTVTHTAEFDHNERYETSEPAPFDD